MPTFSNRPLTFDDLMVPQDSEGLPAPGGVALTGGASSGYRVDPRYDAQLATNWASTAPPQPTPEQIARASLANAAAAGYTNNNREISRVTAFRDRPARPPTATDQMWSAATNGWSDKAVAAGGAAIDAVRSGDDLYDAYQRDLEERRKWLAQRNSAPTPAGSMDAARAELARGLAAGKNGNEDIYRTAAFQQGLSPATALTPFMNGLSMGWWGMSLKPPDAP